MKLLVRWLCGVSMGVLSHCASFAQSGTPFHVPVYTGTPLMISAGIVTRQILNRQISMPNRGVSESPRPAAAPDAPRPNSFPAAGSLLVGAEPAGVPAKLAQDFPAAARASAEQTYRQMLGKYPQLMKQLGVPSDDLASAVATFLAGSYVAYKDVSFPDRNFRPLYEQIRGIIATDPAFARSSQPERRDTYERMAIIGVYMALTREALVQHPDPVIAANMKTAARGYLQQFMNLDPDRIRISERGLSVE